MQYKYLIALLLLLAPAASARAETGPQKALTLDDNVVVKYGARMRVTKSAWNFALLTIRDNFKTWQAPNGASGMGGANLLLDPGYDLVNHGSAGFVRTTPFLWDWARYDNFWRYTSTCSGGGCISSSCRASASCGGACAVQRGIRPPDQGLPSWTQVKRPGCVVANMRPMAPWFYHSGNRFREYGFYVADPGADFKQMQFCTNKGTDGDFQFDAGSGKTGQCDGTRIAQWIGTTVLGINVGTTVYLWYNVRLFLFPNNRTEYMGIGGAYTRDIRHGAETWNPTVDRGNFAYVGGNGVYCWTEANCMYADCWRRCSNCCYTWNSCDDWDSACRNGGNTDIFKYEYSTFSMNDPGDARGNDDPISPWNTRDGTYFRQGDDTAIYTNIGQMQIHSVDRNTFRGVEATLNTRGCWEEKYYRGTWGAQPNYGNTFRKMANCMYPKSYWDGTRWKACDPFDSWNADGTANRFSDDHYFTYPGDPATGLNFNGGGNSPGRCGRQPLCTVGTTGKCTTTANGRWTDDSRTTNFKDMLKPGGGWYLLEITDLTQNPGAAVVTADPATHPRLELKLKIPDVRVELGAAINLRLEGDLVVDETYRDVRATGQIRFDSIDIDATIRIYSLDDKSCEVGKPATCATPFNPYNDNNKIRPDKLFFDIQINNFVINVGGAWYKGSCDNVNAVLLRTFGIDAITGQISACDILNDQIVIRTNIFGLTVGPVSVGLVDMLKGIVEDALQDEIKAALADFVAAVPNLNSILGDPINMNTSLIETGIYMTGANSEGLTMADQTRRWPIAMQTYSSPDREITDFRMSLGFRPIAFTNGANNVLIPYTGDAPSNGAFYGVPDLYDPDTSNCNATNCSKGAHAAARDEDQQADSDDYALTGSAVYRNPENGVATAVAQYQRIPEFYKGPIPDHRKPPAWCSNGYGKGGPANIITSNPTYYRNGTAADLAFLYPQTTWLSFDPAWDKPPAAAGQALPAARNTFGGWDAMLPGTVFKQEANDGSKETTNLPYDFSLHIHQRTIVQFLQAMVASGVTCIEFAEKDTEGNDTPFKPFLSTDAFAAFLPHVQQMFPKSYMKVRIDSMGTPRARTGMGALRYEPSFSASSFSSPGGPPAGEAPLPLCNLQLNGATGKYECAGAIPYMLSMSFPDTRIQFIVADEKTNTEVPVLTMYWTPVLGVHAQSVRRCYYLDPWKDLDACKSPFVNVRTVSGYYEIYVDLNADSLQQSWVNAKDYPTGFFSDIGTARYHSTAAAANKRSIVVEQSICPSAKCNLQGLSNLIPTLMDSMVSLFLVSRFSFQDLTLDFLYTGPDGPNDDGVGAGGVGGGDYIGIYARFLGSLDLFSLLSNAGSLLGAPGTLEPKAYVTDTGEAIIVNTNEPSFPVQMVKRLGDKSDIAYTYSLDGGFWKTQRNDKELRLAGLLEGEHQLQLRAVEHTPSGTVASLTPTVLRFTVDTVPPRVDIPPSPTGYYEKEVAIAAADLQTPADRLETTYRWDDDDDWEPLEGDAVPLRGLDAGRHTLRVRSQDLAGNVGEAAREVVVKGAASRWGCGAAGAADAGWLIVLFALLPLVRRRAR